MSHIGFAYKSFKRKYARFEVINITKRLTIVFLIIDSIYAIPLMNIILALSIFHVNKLSPHLYYKTLQLEQAQSYLLLISINIIQAELISENESEKTILRIFLSTVNLVCLIDIFIMFLTIKLRQLDWDNIRLKIPLLRSLIARSRVRDRKIVIGYWK